MHYSHAQTPVELLKWARAMAKVLTKHYSKGETVPIFVYMGMSGIATATALSMALSNLKNPICYGMMYVRKAEEDAHGQRVETNVISETGVDVYDLKNHPHEFVFVDDFICAGGTLIECALAYQKYMDELLILGEQSFVVLTGMRRTPLYEMTPMFGVKDSASYEDSPQTINRLLLNDHKTRVKAKNDSVKALKEMIDWV